LDDVCVYVVKFWVASKEAPIFYLLLFLALACKAIAAIAPAGAYQSRDHTSAHTCVIGEVVREETAEYSIGARDC